MMRKPDSFWRAPALAPARSRRLRALTGALIICAGVASASCEDTANTTPRADAPDIDAQRDAASPADAALNDDPADSSDARDIVEDARAPQDPDAQSGGPITHDVRLADTAAPDAASEDARAPEDARSGRDGLVVDDITFTPSGPPAGTTLLYRVDFEDGSTAASTGESKKETSAGDNSGGQITVVDNPQKDIRNLSDYVGLHQIPPGNRRAELSSQRLPTDGETYLYKWSYFLPDDYFDAGISWNIISQWKTWPCGKHDGFADQICGNGGIFNDIDVSSDKFNFRYRAEPACDDAPATMHTGRWVNFAQEIHWSNAHDGYARLWQDDTLIYEREDFKTLFDDFEPGRCDIYWGLGLYADTERGLKIYTDNIEIWSL